MLLIIYLIGVIIAVYLIDDAIYNHPENNIDGCIVGYCFTLLSWLIVLVFILIKGEEYICRIFKRKYL